MAAATLHLILRHLRRAVSATRADGSTDRQLLERFAGPCDQAAFAALVERHGTLIHAVCRRILGHSPDADDVFQATFIVLARKARSLRWHESIGPWLHAVAVRLAQRAKADAARRRNRERQADPRPVSDPLHEILSRELHAVLDLELQGLAHSYRAPLILCYLEGQTRDAAAQQLGWSIGTLKRRLERGRELLRRRLTRRGLALSTIALGMALEETTAGAAPVQLSASATRLAVLLAHSDAPAPGLSSRVAVLVDGMMKAFAVSKLKIAAAVLLAGGLLAAGAGVVAHQARQEIPQAEMEGLDAKAPAQGKLQTNDRQARLDAHGDPLPDEAINRLGTIRLRHGGFIYFMRFLPDGKTLLSHGSDGARTWDIASGKQIRSFPQEGSWHAVAVAADGTQLATSGKDGILIRDADSGKEVRGLGAGEYSVLSYSADGRTLAAQGVNPSRLELWDLNSGRQLPLQQAVSAPPSSLFSFLAFGDGGKTLIAGGSPYLRMPPHADNQFHIWEVTTGKEKRHFSVGPGNLWKIALSPDGTVLALGFYGEKGPQNRIALWDTASGKLIHTLVGKAQKPVPGGNPCFNALAFTPDGKSLLAGGIDDTLLLFDLRTGEEVRRFGKNIRNPDVLAISPDGKTVAVQIACTAIRLLDLPTGTESLPRSGPEWPIHQMQVTPDSRTVVTPESNVILFWDSMTGQIRHRLQVNFDYIAAMRLTRDGHKLIAMCADLAPRRRALHVWELPTGKELRFIPLNDQDAGYDSLLAVAGDSNTLAYAGGGGSIVVLDLTTGKEVHRLKGHAPLTLGAAFADDGRTLVVWCGDQVIHRWDLGTGQETRHSFSEPPPRAGMMRPPPVGGRSLVYGAALSPDGRTIALATQTDRIIMLDLAGGKVRNLDNLAENTMMLTFAPDGKTLAWGGQGSGNIHLVECATGRERHRFSGQRGGIESLAFSGDGKVLVSGSDDTTAVLWDLTGRIAGRESWGKPLSRAELEALGADLADENAGRAFKAIQTLAASPAQAVPYLARLLPPVAAVDEQRLTRLVSDLNSDRFAVRNQATAELGKFAELAVPFLQKTLKANPSLEMRQRITSLLTRAEQEKLSPSSETLRGIRTVEILERTGTPESRRLLETYAQGGHGARLTEEAKAASQRHGSWQR